MVLSFQSANKKPPQGDGPLMGHSLEIYQSTLQKDLILLPTKPTFSGNLAKSDILLRKTAKLP